MTTELPSCPKCGSPNTASNGGLRIICRDCGRQSNKVYLPRRKPDYAKRPRCPRCGAQYAIKHVTDWLCGVCGACWPKEVLDENN